MADLDAVQHAIEHACAAFQNPALRPQAEQTILQFKQSQRPIAACQHILEKSGSIEARFHAAATIRDAVIREWTVYSPPDILALKAYILGYVLKWSEPAQLHVVRSSLISSFAVIVKRAWRDFSPADRAQVFQDLQAEVERTGTPTARRVGLETLDALVSEFSCASASRLGLPLEFHQFCHSDMEAHYLKSVFQHAVAVGQQAVQGGAALRGEEGGTCGAALCLMATILAWEFTRGSSLSSPADRPEGTTAAPAGPGVVRAGQDWAEVLLSPATTSWLLQLLPSLRGPAMSSPLAPRIRQLIVSFCSLPASIFPKAAAGQYKEAHLRAMLMAVLQWVAPPAEALRQAASLDDQELVDGCRALVALAATHKAAALERVGQKVLGAQGASALRVLQELTQGLVEQGGVGTDAWETWLGDCTEMMLETWALLLQPEGTMSLASTEMPSAAPAAAAAVFESLVAASLQQVAQSVHEEVQDELEATHAAAQDEWMTRVACIARISASHSLPVLASRITQVRQRLLSSLSQGADPSELLEQLCWLLRMSAHVLADSGSGETPLVPEGLLAEAGRAGGGVEALSGALLETVALALQNASFASPRLMEEIVWAGARWADTYLFPDEEPLPPALAAALGAAGQGPAALQLLAQLPPHCLSAYPGESQLHSQVCKVLLPTLVRRQAVCTRLTSLPPWVQLADGLTVQRASLAAHLSQKQHRALAYALCLAGASAPDPAAQVTALLSPVAGDVVALAQRPDLATITQQAGAMQQVCCSLEVLRGAARATVPPTQPVLLSMFLMLLPALLQLAGAVHHHALALPLLLKLAADITESQISYLQEHEATTLLQWVLHLLQGYAQRASGAMAVGAGRAARLLQEEEEDRQRHICALLALLAHTTQRELADLTPAGGPNGGAGAAGDVASVGQVVVVGMTILLPLMSEELLKFRKVVARYYSLLAHVLEVHPHHVAGLPPPQFAALMSTLQVGLQHADPTPVHSSLEALAGLATWHYREHQAGRAGLAGITTGGPPLGPQFLEVVLRRLLTEADPQQHLEAAADALLPLVLAHPAAYEQLGRALIDSVVDPGAKEGLGGALARLFEGLAGDLSRPQQRKFRESLRGMVAAVRGLVRTR